MKILSLMILFAFCFSDHSIPWVKLDVAKQLAKKENKPIMVMVSYKHCPECRYVKCVVYEDEKIKETISHKYISVVYEFDDKELPQQFKAHGVPRFYFLNSSSEIKGYHLGGLRVNKMQTLLDNYLKTTK